MGASLIDITIVALYFLALVFVGYRHGRGKRDNPDQYFISKGNLPWWVIAAAYVSTGMNTEQLIGQNGMGYKIGLTMVNWYLVALFVYSALIFVFLPIYLRNGILTMPEYLSRRFDERCANVVSVILLISYVFINLAVVFYGGAKLMEVVMGIPVWFGAAILGITVGLYTTYGGMSSASYTAVIQFILIFVSGFILFAPLFYRYPTDSRGQWRILNEIIEFKEIEGCSLGYSRAQVYPKAVNARLRFLSNNSSMETGQSSNPTRRLP